MEQARRWRNDLPFKKSVNETFMVIKDEVRSALTNNQPVVALESTVIAHGLPRPQNIATAARLERIVRDAGSTPATVAVLDGELCVGLTTKQIEAIANSEGVKKLSTKDLAIAVAEKWNGAT